MDQLNESDLKCHCLMICDFSCSCLGQTEYFCYSHARHHLYHNSLQFIPNRNKITQTHSIISELSRKKAELEHCLQNCIDTSDKFIEEIKSVCHLTVIKFRNCINDIARACDALSNLKINHPCNYLAMHSYLFDYDFALIDELFSFQSGYEKNKNHLEKLFIVKSNTDTLEKSFNYAGFDQDYFTQEMERLLLIKQMKTLKNVCKMDWVSGSYKVLRLNRVKRGMNDSNVYDSKTIDINIEIQSIFSKYTKRARRVSIHDLSFSNEQFDKIAKGLLNYKYIRILEISHAIEGEFQVNCLASMLQSMPFIKCLTLNKNYLCDQGALQLIKSMKDFYQLRELQLTENYLTHVTAQFLLETLAILPRLVMLDLSKNQFGPQGASILKNVLQKLRLLEELRISSNNLQAGGVSDIMEGVYLLPHISILDVSDNELFDEGGLIVAEFGRHMKCLNKLYVDLVLSDDAIKILIDAVSPICKIIGRNSEHRKVIRQYNL